MTAVVDRLEGEWAVLEVAGAEVRVPRGWIPSGAREGTALRLEIRRAAGETRLVFRADSSATRRARAKAEALVRRLTRD
jgi:hypothetical protein